MQTQLSRGGKGVGDDIRVEYTNSVGYTTRYYRSAVRSHGDKLRGKVWLRGGRARDDHVQLDTRCAEALGGRVEEVDPRVRLLEVERLDGDERRVLDGARPVHGRELNVRALPPRQFSHAQRPGALPVHDHRHQARLGEPPRCWSRDTRKFFHRKYPEGAASHPSVGRRDGRVQAFHRRFRGRPARPDSRSLFSPGPSPSPLAGLVASLEGSAGAPPPHLRPR